MALTVSDRFLSSYLGCFLLPFITAGFLTVRYLGLPMMTYRGGFRTASELTEYSSRRRQRARPRRSSAVLELHIGVLVMSCVVTQILTSCRGRMPAQKGEFSTESHSNLMSFYFFKTFVLCLYLLFIAYICLFFLIIVFATRQFQNI